MKLIKIGQFYYDLGALVAMRPVAGEAEVASGLLFRGMKPVWLNHDQTKKLREFLASKGAVDLGDDDPVHWDMDDF